ncbi:MAG: cytochrome P450 [Terriglobus roseus]|nr:cytochrome P450 [Terriglobus roseus]
MAASVVPPLSLGTWLLLAVSILALGRAVQLHLVRRKFIRDNGCKPLESHYPIRDPVFGSDLLRDNIVAAKNHKLLEVGKERFDKYGRTFSTKLASGPAIATIEPENIKAVLALKFKDFHLVRRQILVGKLLGHGIFSTDGEAWAHSRALLRPNFNKDKLADIEAFERHLQYMFQAIPTDGRTVDLQELFFRLTIDSATEFLFGESVHSLRKGVLAEEGAGSEDDFAWAFNYAQSAGVTRNRLGVFRHFVRDKTDDKACRICHEYVDRFVDRAVRHREQLDLERGEKTGAVDVDAEEEKGVNYFFINELAKQTKDRLRIRTESMNILLAGRDTTASLLSNMFFQLAKNPRVWAKMQKEVEDTLHGELPTYEQLRNLKYIRWCLNECMFEQSFLISPRVVSLTDYHSAPFAPRRPRKLAHRDPRHRHPPRRRSRRPITPPCEEGHVGPLLAVVHAPRRAVVWPRRGGVPTREVGDAAPWLGVPPVQRRAEDLPGPAVRPDGGELHDRADPADVQEHREPRPRPVGGEPDVDDGQQERVQGRLVVALPMSCMPGPLRLGVRMACISRRRAFLP